MRPTGMAASGLSPTLMVKIVHSPPPGFGTVEPMVVATVLLTHPKSSTHFPAGKWHLTIYGFFYLSYSSVNRDSADTEMISYNTV